jgi:type III restriction enzyme
MGGLDPHLRDRFQKMAKNLRRGLVYGTPHSVIGLLCACFDFALNDRGKLEGVFKAVRESFRLPGSRKLLDRLTAVNEFRNTYVAHHEKELNDKALAGRNLKQWVETLPLLRI